MTKRIFRAIFNVSLLILIASTFILVAFVGDYNSNQTKEAMHADAVYIAKAMETEGISYLEQLPKQNQRITWIDTDGTVLYDSYVDVSQMENHGEREEVVEALNTGRGESTRHSTTLAEKTENYAIKLSDGTILRLSVTSLSALSIFLSMTQLLALVLVIALILAGFLASKTSKSIVKPLENVDLEHPEQAEIYDEMAPFLRRIAVQNKLINKQMQDRQRRQREFETITENMQEGLLVLDARGEVLSCNKGARRLLGVDRVVAGVVLLLFDNTEKADREKLRREFTANVSHELKTPLTSISGFAEIMKNGMVKAEDVPRFANNIYEEAQRLISMVQDIIQLSRLDEAQENVEKTDVDVALIAETVAKRLETQAAQKKIKFHLETETAVLSGVPHVLEEMIYNLCDNAIRYNKDNGSVTLKVEKHPDDITVTVADTGIGIPYGEQERVFERFYRVSRSRSKDVDGTGLGLSIVKHGAMLHNATISMDSEPGKGTEIRLIFSLAEK